MDASPPNMATSLPNGPNTLSMPLDGVYRLICLVKSHLSTYSDETKDIIAFNLKVGFLYSPDNPELMGDPKRHII